MRRTVRRDLRLTRAQLELLEFRAPPHPTLGTPQIEHVGILGEFGGGKTFLAALRFLMICAELPSADRYDPIVSGVSAPTMKSLIQGPLTALRRHGIPVRVDRLGDTRDPHLMLTNWHKIAVYTGQGALEGPNLAQFWADEIQHRTYEGAWANMMGRVRDTRARRLNAQASGIATHGYVASIFRNPPDDACHLTRLLFPEGNAENLPPGYAEAVLAASVGGRVRDPNGWMIPDGLFYPSFSRERNMDPVAHLVRVDLHRRATDISVDFGAREAVSWWQPHQCVVATDTAGGTRREQGQLCVDQWMVDDITADGLARGCRERDWHIEPGVSTLALDPTAQVDQIRAFTEAFPGVRVVMAPPKSFYWHNDNGERAVGRAICDGLWSTRLFVHPDLAGDESTRGVVEALMGYRRDKPKDKVLEHAADTVRYQIQHRLPLPNVTRQIQSLSLGSDDLRGGDLFWR